MGEKKSERQSFLSFFFVGFPDLVGEKKRDGCGGDGGGGVWVVVMVVEGSHGYLV